MLRPEQVKPCLLHAEQAVREHAITYFDTGCSTDRELIPLIFQAYDSYGEEGSLSLLSFATRFSQTEDSLRKTIDRLEHTESAQIAYQYSSIIASADAHLLSPMMPDLNQTHNLTEEALGIIREKTRLSETSTPDLLGELMQQEGCGHLPSACSTEDQRPRFIAEILGERDDLDTDAVAAVLRDEENWEHYDELHLVIVAGLARIEEAVPTLLNRLRADTDLLCDEVNRALIRIGTEEVIRQLAERFPHEHNHFRLFSSAIFGGIKRPVSEEALLQLFPREDNTSIRTLLAMEFCHLISSEGLAHVWRLIDEEEYDQTIVDMREPLYGAGRILGIDRADLPQTPSRRNRGAHFPF